DPLHLPARAHRGRPRPRTRGACARHGRIARRDGGGRHALRRPRGPPWTEGGAAVVDPHLQPGRRALRTRAGRRCPRRGTHRHGPRGGRRVGDRPCAPRRDGAAPAARPLRAAPYLGRAFGLAVLNMSSYWLTYTWLPTYLREERGLSIAGSGTKVLVVVLGELLGYASFGLVSDRFGRRPAFSLYAALMAV